MKRERDPNRIYRGVFSPVTSLNPNRNATEHRIEVVSYGRARDLPWRLDVLNKSPTGLSWGYRGSGPHQAALAILCDAVGVKLAKQYYQRFVAAFISCYDQGKGWELPLPEVLDWVQAHAFQDEVREKVQRTIDGIQP